jgi:DNA-directed RNA polymerase subunit RPC12/RpoP
MHQIYIAAVLTTALAVAIFGTLIRKLRLPANPRLFWLAFLIVLPLEPASFYFVRVPLDHWLTGLLGRDSATLHWLATFYAPLTEEPAKLVPLLIPAIRRDINAGNFARYALAIGLGFAIGEMWFIAEIIARNPKFAGVPFYFFGGYLSERLMVCLFHSAFVAVALWQLRKRFVLGVAGAMALHWLGNFPIFLMASNAFAMGPTFWGIALQSWIVIYFLGALALLSYFVFGRVSPGRFLYGRRKCPECGAEYDGPLFAMNLGARRYERCPHCRHWHFTSASAS